MKLFYDINPEAKIQLSMSTSPVTNEKRDMIGVCRSVIFSDKRGGILPPGKKERTTAVLKTIRHWLREFCSNHRSPDTGMRLELQLSKLK